MVQRFLDDTRDSRYQLLNEEGKLYAAATGPQTVAASGYLVLEITNPADSSQMIEFIRVEGGTLTDTTLDFLRNSSFTVSGTSVTPRNRNWDYSDSSSMTARYAAHTSDPTSGGDLLTSLVQTAGSIDVKYDGEFLLNNGPTDRQFTVRLKNTGSQVGIAALSVTWMEP